MKIVIVGSKWIAAELLKQCLANGHEVLAAIAPKSSTDEYDRLYSTAQQLGIKADTHGKRLTAEDIPGQPDVILAAHAHAFIDKSARDKSRYGVLAYHPSLLPRHRGRDAIEWTIRMHEPVAGGTVYWMDEGADTGPIAAQDWCHVQPGDNAITLWRRDLAPMGLKLFNKALDDLMRGVKIMVPQNDISATWEPAIKAKRLADT